MKRILLSLALVLMLAQVALAGTIPITGTIRLANGASFNGKVRFTLSYPAQDSTVPTIVVPQTVEFAVANGALPATARITPNDILAPSATTYTVEYFTPAGARVMQNVFYISGASFNLAAAVPTSITTSNISFVNIFSGTGTANTVAKFTGTSTVGNSGITDTGSIITMTTGSSERMRLQADGTVSIGTSTDVAAGMHVITSNSEIARFGSTSGTATISLYGTSGGAQTLFGQISANSTEVDLCSATGPCNSGYGVTATYTSAFGSDPIGMRIASTSGTSGLGLYTSSTYRGGITANSSAITFCGGTGPCAAGVTNYSDRVETFGANPTDTFNIKGSDSSEVRQNWIYNATTLAGMMRGTSAGLNLTASAGGAIDLTGTSSNVLDVVTSNATNTTRFYASTGTLAGFIAGSATEFDFCSASGPCAASFSVFNATQTFYLNASGYRLASGRYSGAGVGPQFCIVTNSNGNRLVDSDGTYFTDGGACPY